MIFVISYHWLVLVPFPLFTAQILEVWGNHENSIEIALVQLSAGFKNEFSLYLSGNINTSWAGMLACLLVHHAREARMPPRSNYSLFESFLIKIKTSDFSEKNPQLLYSGTESNYFIFYHSLLKIFSLCFSLVQILNSPSPPFSAVQIVGLFW